MSESDSYFKPNIEQKKVQMKKMTLSEIRRCQNEAGSSSDDFVSETTQSFTAPLLGGGMGRGRGEGRGGGRGKGRGGGRGGGKGGGWGEGRRGERGGGTVRERVGTVRGGGDCVPARKVPKMISVKTTLSQELLRNKFDDSLLQQANNTMPGKHILL